MTEGQDVREDRVYSEEHEWAKVEGDVVIIGITDFAQHQLHEITFVEISDSGTVLQAGDECGLVESMKASSEIYTPISGEIVEINDNLEDSPEIVNESPFEKGWLMKIKPSNLDEELGKMMDAAAYKEFIASQ
jgi:glycine cleavage system H protein